MNSYIDIHLLPDSELKEAELSSKVYTKFHKALVALRTDRIGISFPLVNLKLGLLFRIHGDGSLLHDLQGLDWLGSLKGYCKVQEVKAIPDQVQYRVISAKRSNLSQAKLKRLIKRGSIDEAGIKRYRVKMLSLGFDNPFLDLQSESRGQLYRKFFGFSELVNQSTEGSFDSFGLSKSATVPWF